jgi:hypothetical protein
MKVWMLCEAFTLTGDAFARQQMVHESLAPWCLPCESRKVAMRELEECVKERVLENYEGLDDADEDIESDIRNVMACGTRLGRSKYEYRYSTDDREVCWRVYPCEVMR